MLAMVVFRLGTVTDLTISVLSLAGGVKVQSTVSGPVFLAPLKEKVCVFTLSGILIWM